VTLLDTDTRFETLTLEGEWLSLGRLAFSPDGTLLVGTDGDGEEPWMGNEGTRVWHAATPDQVAVHQPQRPPGLTVGHNKLADWQGRSARFRLLHTKVSDNTGSLTVRHRSDLTFASHLVPAQRFGAVDFTPYTGWMPFGVRRGQPVPGPTRWFEVGFPTAVTVRRVTLVGNRPWGSGLPALKLELRDANGKVIRSQAGECVGDYHDFEFRLPTPVEEVTALHFILPVDMEPKAAGSVSVAEILAE
jgi:hypothetical protein